MGLFDRKLREDNGGKISGPEAHGAASPRNAATMSDAVRRSTELDAEILQKRANIEKEVAQRRSDLQLEVLQRRIDLQTEIDQKRAELEAELDQKRAELEEELDRKRAELEKELDQQREEAERAIQEKTRAFSDNYNYYLSQLKLVMDMLTRSATRVGERFIVDEDADPTTLFRSEMSSGLNPELFSQTRQPVWMKTEETGPDRASAAAEAAAVDQTQAEKIPEAATAQPQAGEVPEAAVSRPEPEKTANVPVGVAVNGPEQSVMPLQTEKIPEQAVVTQPQQVRKTPPKKKKKKRSGFNLISVLAWLFNLLVAIGCILIVVLIAYFFYLTFFRGFGGSGALFYICDKIASWWHMMCSWVGSLLP